jgi:crotonobetainyl-CoA:carnitine CoA-transferase CaiB-like acyl-CoA transferase
MPFNEAVVINWTGRSVWLRRNKLVDSSIGTSGPLSGFRVVDFTANMSGPLATMILGDQGADVVKVEPPHGDSLRSIGTSRQGMAALFANLNRSKRSVVIDVTTASGRAIADRLIDTADVVVQNFRPAAAQRLGLSGPQLRRTRPRLVTANVTGFAFTGPGADLPVYDHVIQAASGIASLQADRQTGEPALIRQAIVDKVTAFYLAQAITAALLQRARTGEGCDLDVCMLDAAVAFLWPDGMMSHTIDEPDVVRPPVAKNFRLFQTSDGHVAVVALTGAQWQRLASAVGEPWSDGQQAGAVLKRTASTLRELSTDEVVALMTAHDVPCAAVVSLEDLTGHPLLAGGGTVAAFEHPVLGPIRQANPVVDFGVGDAATLRPAPHLGRHTGEVLSEIGLSEADLASLAGQGVIGLR